VVERAPQQLIADAEALMSGRHELLREKPQLAANPAEGEANHVVAVFRHPQPGGIVLDREQLKMRRAHRGHRAKAVPFSEIVDAADHEPLRPFQFIGARRPDYDWQNDPPRLGDRS
jgi:hypothetical protein